MSDFDIIIPIAIILLIALASGGGGGSRVRIIQPPSDPPFDAQVGNVYFPDLEELYNEDFEKENLLESALTSPEVDFTKSRAIWRQTPDNGKNLLQIASETLQKLYYTNQQLQEAISYSREKQSDQSGQDIYDHINDYTQEQAELINLYKNELQMTLLHIKKSLDNPIDNWSFVPGEEEQFMTIDDRFELSSRLTGALEEWMDFEDRISETIMDANQQAARVSILEEPPQQPMQTEFSSSDGWTGSGLDNITYPDQPETPIFANTPDLRPPQHKPWSTGVQYSGDIKNPLQELNEAMRDLTAFEKEVSHVEESRTPPGSPPKRAPLGTPDFNRISHTVKELIANPFEVRSAPPAEPTQRMLDFTPPDRPDLDDVPKWQTKGGTDPPSPLDFSTPAPTKQKPIPPWKKPTVTAPTTKPRTVQSISGTPIAKLISFQTDLRGKSKSAFEHFRNKDKKSLQFIEDTLKHETPEGFPQSSFYTAMVSHKDIMASNGKTIPYSTLSKDRYFKNYVDVLKGIRENLAQL
jgi:hypothetical protein